MNTLPKTAALIAFMMSFALAIAKGILWIFSDSATVLASFADSLQDCFLSATNFMAIRYAMRPADDDHRYGHGKMEGIAALGQAAFICGSCVFIVMDSLRGLTEARVIDHPVWILATITGAIVLNAGLVIYQNYVIKKSGSLAIEADRAHYAGDIGIHLGVIIAVLAQTYLGWFWVDAVIAIGIAVWLIYLARDVGCKAIAMLMDRELEPKDRNTIKDIIAKTPGVVYYHDLRTHRSGQTILMSFDIEIDPSLSFQKAHDIAKRVEDRLHEAYPNAEIMIHMDPCGDIADSRHKEIKHHHVK